MEVDITLMQLWSLLGAAVFLGMIIGALLVALNKSGHSSNAFWEEE